MFYDTGVASEYCYLFDKNGEMIKSIWTSYTVLKAIFSPTVENMSVFLFDNGHIALYRLDSVSKRWEDNVESIGTPTVVNKDMVVALEKGGEHIRFLNFADGILVYETNLNHIAISDMISDSEGYVYIATAKSLVRISSEGRIENEIDLELGEKANITLDDLGNVIVSTGSKLICIGKKQ